MRLTQNQVNEIIDALDPFLTGQRADLRLFGSRARDDEKGGDIDLLLCLESESQKEALIARKHMILAMLKAGLGDQKIDLVIASPGDIGSDPFLRLIFPGSLDLHRWN